ncbi:MAG: amidohydrolase [Bacteroidia bacterium]
MKKLRVTLIQTTLLWEDGNGNRMLMDELFKGIKKGSTDVVVLPEVFTSGFTMNAPKVAEHMHGKTLQWMLETAKRKNAVVCGSLVVCVGKNHFNRFVWVEPGGRVVHYDKRHLFRMAGEDRVFTAGRKRVVIDYKGWRICPQICYDLRFPVWSRNKNDYDVMLYIANWPERRRHAWKSLLVARAIENQCYVVAVNRVGTDGKNLAYAGDSVVHDMWGESMTNIKPYKGSVVTVSLDLNALLKARKDFPVDLDRDRFSLVS